MFNANETILLMMPAYLVPPERVVNVANLNNKDLVVLYRNTCCTRYREEVFSDTQHKIDFLRSGEQHLHHELLRRLQPDSATDSPPPASTGGGRMLAACLAKVQQLQHYIAPNLAPKSQTQASQQTTETTPTRSQHQSRRAEPLASAKPRTSISNARRDRGGMEM